MKYIHEISIGVLIYLTIFLLLFTPKLFHINMFTNLDIVLYSLGFSNILIILLGIGDITKTDKITTLKLCGIMSVTIFIIALITYLIIILFL